MDHNKDNYELYIKSEAWKEKRIKKAIEQKYTCEKCGKVVKKGFHVHHKTYKNFRNEPLCDLMFLCEDCHINEHCKIKAFTNNKKKPQKEQKHCKNCLYSQLMKYKNSSKIVLYCNKMICECENVCRWYKKGDTKSLPKTKKTEKINFKCKYCFNTKYTIKKYVHNTGIYCAKCGKWDKFLNKKEKRLLNI